MSYTLTPQFIDSVTPAAPPREAQTRGCRLPVTTIPAQVPKIVGAGYALSPYQRNHEYSETAVRQRYLWLEFAEPIRDPNDTYFARVLAYAPDPLLSFPNPDQLLVRQDDPPLAIAPELIRVITQGLSNDNAGIDAMQPMVEETADPSTPLIQVTPVHYMLPLPHGLHAESPELFGFFTYELRVGHTSRIWCTAQGRFGHPTRMSGVQHPAPPLTVLAERTPGAMVVTAPYATAVFNGRNVTSKPPKTEIWCMLYAQVLQADARQHRNFLLAEARLDLVQAREFDVRTFLARRQALEVRVSNSLTVNVDAPAHGTFTWTEAEIRLLLDQFNLASDTPLSVLAVEMMPRYDQVHHPGRGHGRKRPATVAGAGSAPNSPDVAAGGGTGCLLRELLTECPARRRAGDDRFDLTAATNVLVQLPRVRSWHRSCFVRVMIKLVGSYILAKLLGFGLLGAVVIYALISLFT